MDGNMRRVYDENSRIVHPNLTEGGELREIHGRYVASGRKKYISSVGRFIYESLRNFGALFGFARRKYFRD